MQRTILLRYGELFLKGKNKNYFEKLLISNIKQTIKEFDFELKRTSGRYYIINYDVTKENKIVNKLKNVFGLYSLSVANMMDTNLENITEYVKSINCKDKKFRVTVNRADKSFGINSNELACMMGGVVLDQYNTASVSLKDYEVNITLDIRENGKTFGFDKVIDCVHGLPVGSAGKGLLLLSGGIDSPVAGYNIIKRGMKLSALHFHSYPYTSMQAKEKVINLAKTLTEYNADIKLYVVNFKEIQENIHKHCNEEYMITIMRRFMMKIAEKICLDNSYQAIITGESLGQVASQTIESLTSTNSVLNTIPVLRPLIGMDKDEITVISKKIDAFDISILPYEDCCTVFLPKHPLIKPRLDKVAKEESKLEVEQLIEKALADIEVINI